MMIDQHKQAFLEEARELLAELEAALLELDQRREDPEVVGRAFRALHTIKGSGAMFGFDDISGFAHHLESAFDQLRKGQLQATTDLINLSLSAGDQIKAMLEAASGRGAADAARSEGIVDQLRRLTGAPVPNRPATLDSPPAPSSAAPSGPASQWRIRFRPSRELFLNGTNPLLLFRELAQLGSLEIQADTSTIPSLAEMDPERCYLAWDMVLTTTSGREAIQDIFIFVEGECELTIEPARGRCAGSCRIPGRASRSQASGRRRAQQLEPAGLGRKIGPAGQSGGRAGDGASAAGRNRSAPGRPGCRGRVGRNRTAELGAAREFDEHPHAAAAQHLRTIPAAGP